MFSVMEVMKWHKGKQRSSEITERANTYDGYINPWIEKMYNGTVTDTRDEYVSGVKYRIYTYVTDVQGPDAADGVGYYIARNKLYEIIYTGILGWKKKVEKNINVIRLHHVELMK